MSKPFDATTKNLVSLDPDAWLRLLGLPGRGAVVVDAELSTVASEADRVLRVEGAAPYMAHLEFESSYKASSPRRYCRYNVQLFERYGLDVDTSVILLRPEADGKELTGSLSRTTPSGLRLHWDYRVFRVWQHPPEVYLEGALAMVPMAPLADVPTNRLPEVIQTMRGRLDAEAPAELLKPLWTASYLLMGLRYQEALIQEVLRMAVDLRDSVTYQAILREGRTEGRVEGRTEGQLEEARAIILRLGRRRFGEPTQEILDWLSSIASLVQMELLIDRLVEAESWTELVDGIVV